MFETALPFRGDALHVVYAVQITEEICSVHAFRKKSTQTRNRPGQGRAEQTEGDVGIRSEKLEVVRGSGNVFCDLGHNNADVEQFKAILAAEIIKVLDRDGLSVRAAHDRTGIAAADFSRIRNADLGRFTLDRLMSILNRLGSRVEVSARVWRSEPMERRALVQEQRGGTIQLEIGGRKCDARLIRLRRFSG